MLWIYRRKFSDGAEALAEELCLAGIRARYSQGRRMRERGTPEDRLICWGEPAPNQRFAAVLNGVELRNKFADATVIAAAGVPTVEVSLQRQANVRPVRAPFPIPAGWNHPTMTLSEANVRERIQQMQAYLDAPLPQPVEWLPRRNNHIGGSDLLRPPAAPDYWVKKEDIVEEYRLHMFGGKSIRAGKKVRREQRPDGQPSHDWIRSFDAGWIIAYEEFKSTKQMRELAARAVAALGLDFGAVDLAKKRDGTLIVLEVNRAPGIEGGTVGAYVGAIRGWIGAA